MLASFVVVVLIVNIALLFVAARWLYTLFRDDRLRRFQDELGLSRANLVYASNYQKVRDIVLPARQSAFDKTEPAIWIYKNGDTELFLGASWRGDLRIWSEVESVLRNVHVVLDGMSNNGYKTNLDRSKLPKQKVTLEGDFPKHFSLYCTDGQQVLALQLIAPDVMAYILDNFLHVDIEIVESQIAIIIQNGAESVDKIKIGIELGKRLERIARAVRKVQTV